jgi:colicin import membrane protein
LNAKQAKAASSKAPATQPTQEPKIVEPNISQQKSVAENKRKRDSGFTEDEIIIMRGDKPKQPSAEPSGGIFAEVEVNETIKEKNHVAPSNVQLKKEAKAKLEQVHQNIQKAKKLQTEMDKAEAKKHKELKAKQIQEKKAKALADKRAREEKLRKEKEEKLKIDKKKKARELAEKRAREEAKNKAREEKARIAKEKKEKELAEKRAREEALRKAKEKQALEMMPWLDEDTIAVTPSNEMVITKKRNN